MAAPDDIIVVVAAVIAASFLVYFVSRLVLHRKGNHTICMAWVASSIFLALFFRLLSLSTPDFIIYSDLFLLITVIAIIFLTIHMQKSFCNCKSANLEYEAPNTCGISRFQSFKAMRKGLSLDEKSSKKMRLSGVPKQKQVFRKK